MGAGNKVTVNTSPLHGVWGKNIETEGKEVG